MHVYLQIIWILLVTLYPAVTTLFFYYLFLKHSGYAGMVLYPLTGFYLICCLIFNLLFICTTSKRLPLYSRRAWLYLFPAISPIVSGLLLIAYM